MLTSLVHGSIFFIFRWWFWKLHIPRSMFIKTLFTFKISVIDFLQQWQAFTFNITLMTVFQTNLSCSLKQSLFSVLFMQWKTKYKLKVRPNPSNGINITETVKVIRLGQLNKFCSLIYYQFHLAICYTIP